MRYRKLALISILAAVCLSLGMSYAKTAQDDEVEDNLVRLINAESLRQYMEDNVTYRKIMGKARFFHNNTYLLCDTAIWNVDAGFIDAWGNVRILQEQTVLDSDKMLYIIDEDLAQFRGNLVQLQDKDGNTLRTRHLDYNTRDSIALFFNGASMRDKDGQIIESRDGKYDSKEAKFRFMEDVNMFTDSIFVKTVSLVYDTETSVATFGQNINAWKEENMLSADGGWYDREKDLFFFRDKVHVLSKDQEGWSDSLYFNRTDMEITMLGNAQVSDTTRNVYALAGQINYIDSLARVTLVRKPAVISIMEDKEGALDTVYFGADTMVYHAQRMCDIDSLVKVSSATRLENVNIDPVTNFRRQAAAEAAKRAEEAAENDPNAVAKRKAEEIRRSQQQDESMSLRGSGKDIKKALTDSLNVASDSLVIASDSLAMGLDSLAIASDSLAMASDSIVAPLDTTMMGFLSAKTNVRLFKKDMQVICDSLEYSDLDSLAFLYKNPIVWNNVQHQYMADSIVIVVQNNTMKKANLMSNAFVHIQEDTLHYDQIKGAEMTAFFDQDGQLERYDALGGASALFFLEENGAYATVNRKEAKMLSAEFKDGDISKIFYFESPKSDGYPVVQMQEDDKILKGFNWLPDRRPKDKYAVTDIELRAGQRSKYERIPHAKYRNTDMYFPGYIEGIYKEIIERDSLHKIQAAERKRLEHEQELRDQFLADSLDKVRIADSLHLAKVKIQQDSLRNIVIKDSLARVDSLNKIIADSTAFADSVKAAEAKNKKLTKAEKKEIRIAKREARKAKRAELKAQKAKEREKKWAELDKRDEEKAAKKEARKLAKKRRNKLNALRAAEEEARQEAELLEKYKARYEKKLKGKEKRD